MNSGPEASPRSAIETLSATLAEAYDPALYGFPWYGSLADDRIRAVRSNQAISLVDAAISHLNALAGAAHEVADLVGPNGRTIPTRAEPETRQDLDRVSTGMRNALRAAGSVLDVLGGLIVLFLGLPDDPTSAASRHLLQCAPEPRDPSESQAQVLARMREVVEGPVREPAGWVEWTLESRNVMVHRGSALSIWMPVPSRLARGRLAVISSMRPQHLLRQFPHMRRQPDLSDAESILSGAQAGDLYLREPAQDTLRGLAQRSDALAAAVAEVVNDSIGDLERFSWPRSEWALRPRGERARAADEFWGFDGNAPELSADAIYLNPREAKRLLSVDKLRRELDA